MIGVIDNDIGTNLAIQTGAARIAPDAPLFVLPDPAQPEHSLSRLPHEQRRPANEDLPPGEVVPRLGGADSRNMIRTVVPDLDEVIDEYHVGHFDVDEEILEAFRVQLNIHLSGSCGALDINDFERLQIEAHSVKGMGGVLGSPELSVLGFKIEEAARSRDAARCKELVGAMRMWYSTFLENT